MKYQGVPGPVQQAEASIQVLDRFQRYQTIEEYQAETGETAPAFVAAWGEKKWRDPNAMNAKGDYITYEVLEQNETGQWVHVPFRIAKALAARVNLAPEVVPVEDRFGMPQVPMPVRKPVAPEEIGVATFGGGPIVVNRVLVDAAKQQDPLARIEAKIDRLLLKSGA